METERRSERTTNAHGGHKPSWSNGEQQHFERRSKLVTLKRNGGRAHDDELKEFSDDDEGGNDDGNGKDDAAIAQSPTDGVRGANQERNENEGVESATDESSEEERLFKMPLWLNSTPFGMRHDADVDASLKARPLPGRHVLPHLLRRLILATGHLRNTTLVGILLFVIVAIYFSQQICSTSRIMTHLQAMDSSFVMHEVPGAISATADDIRLDDKESKPPDGDYHRSRYCKNGSPCVALLSASHHAGIESLVEPRTLDRKTPAFKDGAENLRNRILVREGYCAVHKCDVIIDYNDYHHNKTMWLSDHGKHKVGSMPPHWKKVAALQRWLPHYDAIVQMDMDAVWVDFDTSVYDLYNETFNVYTDGGVQLIMFKRGEVSQCVVDSWWYYGTSPGCRYFRYPQNHRYQTQDLDMPWFWYASLKCAEIYRSAEPVDCLNTCNGPDEYVDHLGKDKSGTNFHGLWPFNCFGNNRHMISNYTNMTINSTFQRKHLILEMQFGNERPFEDSIKESVAVHCKDRGEMVKWLNETSELMLNAGCTLHSCMGANVWQLQGRLQNWSQRELGQ